MGRYAYVKNGQVANVIIWEGAKGYISDGALIKSDIAEIGQLYKDDVFVDNPDFVQEVVNTDVEDQEKMIQEKIREIAVKALVLDGKMVEADGKVSITKEAPIDDKLVEPVI